MTQGSLTGMMKGRLEVNVAVNLVAEIDVKDPGRVVPQ
jgi:hypothetical protein